MVDGPPARLDGPVGWIASLAGCAINAWTFGVFYSFGLALDLMAEDFGAGSASTAAVQSAFPKKYPASSREARSQ